ncbi:hypothetical protein HZA97_06575 [Candidatus Woesearchaeota archaeon]|nr:hypothetical protein [Candidatus Woesearchaeota archaeon]
MLKRGKTALILLLLIFIISCTSKISCDYKSVSKFLDKADLVGYIKNNLPPTYKNLDECSDSFHFFLNEDQILREFCVQNLANLCTEKTFSHQKALEICDKYLQDYNQKLVDKCEGKQLYCCNCYSAGFTENSIFVYQNQIVSSPEKCEQICGQNSFKLKPTEYSCHAECPEGMNPFKKQINTEYPDGTIGLETYTLCCQQGTVFDQNTQKCENYAESSCPIFIETQ